MTELIEIIKQRWPHSLDIVGPWSNNNFLHLFNNLIEKSGEHSINFIIHSNELDISQHIPKSLSNSRFRKFTVNNAVSYYQKITGKLPLHYLDERIILCLSQKELFSPRFIEKVKRAFDIFFTLLLLPFALPLVLICALAIKLDSSGPVFFIQERLGLGGAPFKVIKLRTMVDNAENTIPQWCKDNDPRITRVGKILRKLRLDELPQLLNVLRNEMSLVGPRPIRRHFTDMLAQEIPSYRLRLLAKPGLTGWAQVHAGHANTMASHAQMLQYDLFYLVHQSLWLDLVILLKTVRTILLGKGR
jgi:exopolysaccharide biosynthesis polyprenyl glycosylphosphotransferase